MTESQWIAVVLLAGIVLTSSAIAAQIGYWIWAYLGRTMRIFEEKPLFIVPRGKPLEGSEDVRIPTTHGLTLAGSYLHTPIVPRRGVVLFGPEFGSNRWSCGAYCGCLLEAGFDIFTFEFRNQGESDKLASYDPLQWVSNHEVADMQAAIRYLKSRPDADTNGIGIFGVSRGGGAGIIAAAGDPWIKCVATDGAFATLTTMVPYMRKWVEIYAERRHLLKVIPRWVYAWVGDRATRNVARRHGCTYPRMERAIRKLAPRPLFMIHGGKDTYIKPAIAQQLFALAREPKDFWLVEGAKHNQALQVAGDEYRRRLVEFFGKHLARTALPATAVCGAASENGALAR